MLFLDTVAGVNQVYEVVKAWTIFPYANKPGPEPRRVVRPAVVLVDGISTARNAAGTDAGEKYQGISFAHRGTSTPRGRRATPERLTLAAAVRSGSGFITTTPRTSGQVQIASLYDPDALDGAPQLIDCAIQPPFVVTVLRRRFRSYGCHATGRGATPVWWPMHNGTMILDLLDNPRCNQIPNSSSAYGPGYYFTHGSGASSRASEAGYFTGRLWAPVPRYT
jgi:hypothetical protein